MSIAYSLRQTDGCRKSRVPISDTSSGTRVGLQESVSAYSVERTACDAFQTTAGSVAVVTANRECEDLAADLMQEVTRVTAVMTVAVVRTVD